MDICLFGTYPDTPEYSRNAVIRESLVASGHRVSQCRPSRRSRLDRVAAFSTSAGVVRAATGLCRDWWDLSGQRRCLAGADLVLVPYPCHADIFLARYLLRGRSIPIVADAFLGLFDTVVSDRQLLKSDGLAARWVSSWESRALRAAHLVLIDTPANRRLLVEDYNLDSEKVFTVPVGIDESIWTASPYRRTKSELLVAFWGTFIPLHGIEVIIEAAKILEARQAPVRFELLGDGQTADLMHELLEERAPANLTWRREVLPITAVRELAERSHCVLGVFSSSGKANRVLPYKLYQALATGRPVISRSSAAVEDTLGDCPAVVCVPPEDPERLAEAIESLAQDSELCSRLSEEARVCYQEKLSNKVIREAVDSALDRFEHQTR